MSTFDDLFQGPAELIDDTFSDPVVYRSINGTVLSDAKATKEENAEIMGGDFETVYLGTTFEFLKAKFGIPVSRGDTIEQGGETFTVERVVSEDKHFIVVLVK